MDNATFVGVADGVGEGLDKEGCFAPIPGVFLGDIGQRSAAHEGHGEPGSPCIVFANFVEGEDRGVLDGGHRFHLHEKALACFGCA